MNKKMCRNSGGLTAGFRFLLFAALTYAFLGCPSEPGDKDDPPLVTGVTVNPSSATVAKGGTQQFTATVTGDNNPAQTVTWSVDGGGETTIVGGLLTVATGETATSLTVRATSTVDITKYGQASVTVTLPALTGSVTLTGTPKVGQTLIVDTSALSGTGSPSYQWQNASSPTGIFDNISGATSSSYTPVETDSGKYIKVTVTRLGVEGSKDSNVIGPIYRSDETVPVIDSVTMSPTTANVVRGVTHSFTATVTPNTSSMSVSWVVTGGVAGTSISGDSNNKGVLSVSANEEAGTVLTVKVISTVDPSKYAEATVTVINPTLTGVVLINGYPRVGNTLTADTNNLSGTGTFSYQWQRADTSGSTYTPVSGATSATYTPVVADDNKYLKVTVSRIGNTGSADSDAVGPVAAALPNTNEITGNVTISNGVEDVTISLTNTGALSLSRLSSLTVTVDGTYQAYNWYVDTVELNDERGNSIKLDGTDYTIGNHRILVIAYRNSVPYSLEIGFTVY